MIICTKPVNIVVWPHYYPTGWLKPANISVWPLYHATRSYINDRQNMLHFWIKAHCIHKSVACGLLLVVLVLILPSRHLGLEMTIACENKVADFCTGISIKTITNSPKTMNPKLMIWDWCLLRRSLPCCKTWLGPTFGWENTGLPYLNGLDKDCLSKKKIACDSDSSCTNLEMSTESQFWESWRFN